MALYFLNLSSPDSVAFLDANPNIEYLDWADFISIREFFKNNNAPRPSFFPSALIQSPAWYDSVSGVKQASYEKIEFELTTEKVTARETELSQRAIDNPVPPQPDQHFDPEIGAPDG